MARDELTRKAIERKLARGRGVGLVALGAMREADKAAVDWRGRCRKCHSVFTGSLEELKGPCPNCAEEA